MNEDQNGKDERKIRILTNEYTILRSSNEEEGSCSSVVMSSDTISNMTKKNVEIINNIPDELTKYKSGTLRENYDINEINYDKIYPELS